MVAIEMLAIVVLALTVVVFVADPLFRRTPEVAALGEISEQAEDLYKRKESTFSALKELEFDFRTGKLSRTDFEELDAKYRTEAVGILEAIDSYESDTAAAEVEDGAEPGACYCGYVSKEGARFCAKCGELLGGPGDAVNTEQGDLFICSECGAELEAEHHFCPGCGAQLEA